MEHKLRKAEASPVTLRQWVEFCWLLFANPTFQKSSDKRRAYYEYRLGKIYNSPCS
jgi:hypothetical protein